MIVGSCQCGGIRFEIEKVTAMTHCHCSVCRKTTGASFATFAHVRSARFKLLSGQDLVNPGYEMDARSRAELLRPMRFSRTEIRRSDWHGQRSGGAVRR